MSATVSLRDALRRLLARDTHSTTTVTTSSTVSTTSTVTDDDLAELDERIARQEALIAPLVARTRVAESDTQHRHRKAQS